MLKVQVLSDGGRDLDSGRGASAMKVSGTDSPLTQRNLELFAG
jgi:hypothetical protein